MPSLKLVSVWSHLRLPVLLLSFTTALIVLNIFLLQSSFSSPLNFLSVSNNALTSPTRWLAHLRALSPTLYTSRLGCREYVAGFQSCVFEGFICVNVSSSNNSTRPHVYFFDESHPDFDPVPSDKWCNLRHQSSDPRYFSSRHWPLLNDTVAPQGSCLTAFYRNPGSLDAEKPSIKWLPSLSLVDLDYLSNPHNNHMLKDIIWLLDVVLWQASMDLKPPRDLLASGQIAQSSGRLFEESPRHLYLPQSESDFVSQTKPDINRLLYSLVLRRNLSALYPNSSVEEMQRPATSPRPTAPLLDAFPDLKGEERLIFHREIQKDNDTELVCTPRLTSGSKLGNLGHERVCRHMRQTSYKFFGISEPPKKRIGFLYYAQPPKRIIVLQRHVTRSIFNLDELEKALRKRFEEPHGVEVEIIRTSELRTAEDHVRMFSRAGVLITSHGSQSMGQIWMPKHSALIEIMPVAYTDYAFSLLADSCKIWYYDLQSKLHPNKTEEYYKKTCVKHENRSHLLDPCSAVKSVDVVADVEEVVKTTVLALEHIGYPMGEWLRASKS